MMKKKREGHLISLFFVLLLFWLHVSLWLWPRSLISVSLLQTSASSIFSSLFLERTQTVEQLDWMADWLNVNWETILAEGVRAQWQWRYCSMKSCRLAVCVFTKAWRSRTFLSLFFLFLPGAIPFCCLIFTSLVSCYLWIKSNLWITQYDLFAGL